MARKQFDDFGIYIKAQTYEEFIDRANEFQGNTVYYEKVFGGFLLFKTQKGKDKWIRENRG